jgi:hypothetical protein
MRPIATVESAGYEGVFVRKIPLDGSTFEEAVLRGRFSQQEDGVR